MLLLVLARPCIRVVTGHATWTLTDGQESPGSSLPAVQRKCHDTEFRAAFQDETVRGKQGVDIGRRPEVDTAAGGGRLSTTSQGCCGSQEMHGKEGGTRFEYACRVLDHEIGDLELVEGPAADDAIDGASTQR